MRGERQTTIEDSGTQVPHAAATSGLRLVILWHRAPERIGRWAWWNCAESPESLEISRHAPLFSDRLGLDNLRISRSPLQILTVPGGVEFWPTRSGLSFDVDGVAGIGGHFVPTASLARGVRLGLGQGVLLHLRLGPPPANSRCTSLVGASTELERVRADIERAARGTETVLILGETGTGKELVAQSLHRLGPRAAHPLVAVNMAALSAALAPSQLFGHVRGAFTGAEDSSPGYFQMAERGTLFLDEIGACPTDVQAQLLRVLETGEVQVIGATPRRLDVRVVSATDASLEAACRSSSFRTALYHRLSQTIISIPPLRDRQSDIAVQAFHFLQEGLARRQRTLRTEGPTEAPWLGREVMDALLDYGWPGNSRELASVIERLIDRHLDDPVCQVPNLAPPLPQSQLDSLVTSPADQDISSSLAETLARCDYNLMATAERMGISRNTLRRRMKEEGLRRPMDLEPEEIDVALQREGGVPPAARALGVSEQGLRLRMRELRIGL